MAMKMKAGVAALAAAAWLAGAAAATAAPILLGSFLHDYGSDPGKIDPSGDDVLFPDFVRVSDQSATLFSDAIDFSAVGAATIDRLALTLKFTGAGPRVRRGQANEAVFETWFVSVQGSDPSTETDDLSVQLSDVFSPQQFVFGAALLRTDNAFETSVAARSVAFRFLETQSDNNEFDLNSVRLDVYGTPAVAAVPLPAGGLLLLTAFGGLAALRRRARAA